MGSMADKTAEQLEAEKVQKNLKAMARIVSEFRTLTSENDRSWVAAELEKIRRESLSQQAGSPTPT